MFNLNSIVVHPTMGVCTVTEIKKMSIGKNPPKDFYVLKPKYENYGTKIYIPVDGKIKLREPLNSEKIKEMLQDAAKAPLVWNNNDMLRKSEFTEILHSGNHFEIIRLIYTLHEMKKEKELSGKKLHLADERIMKEAERLIHGELAYSMNINPENVAEYIMNELL